LLILVHTRISFFCEVKSDLGTTNWCSERGAILSSIQEMGSAKYKVEKFTGQNDFGLWRLKMRAFLVQQGLVEALDGEAKLGIRKHYCRRHIVQLFSVSETRC